MAELAGEEVCHIAVGLFCFWKADVVPEGVGKAFEDDELGVVAVRRKARWRMVVPLRSRSRPLVMKSVGGMLWRSAKRGERTGSLGLVVADVFGIESLWVDDGKRCR